MPAAAARALSTCWVAKRQLRAYLRTKLGMQRMIESIERSIPFSRPRCVLGWRGRWTRHLHDRADLVQRSFVSITEMARKDEEMGAKRAPILQAGFVRNFLGPRAAARARACDSRETRGTV